MGKGGKDFHLAIGEKLAAREDREDDYDARETLRQQIIAVSSTLSWTIKRQSCGPFRITVSNAPQDPQG